MFPAESNAINEGLAKPTSSFGPSILSCAQSPFPAQVVTFPLESIFLIKLLSLSATYKFPEASKTDPSGLLNLASLPIPSLEPVWPEPANVLTWLSSRIS